MKLSKLDFPVGMTMMFASFTMTVTNPILYFVMLIIGMNLAVGNIRSLWNSEKLKAYRYWRQQRKLWKGEK